METCYSKKNKSDKPIAKDESKKCYIDKSLHTNQRTHEGWRVQWMTPKEVNTSYIKALVGGPFLKPKLVKLEPYVITSGCKSCAARSDPLKKLRNGIPDPWLEYLAWQESKSSNKEIAKRDARLCNEYMWLTDYVWKEKGLPMVQGIPDPWKNGMVDCICDKKYNCDTKKKKKIKVIEGDKNQLKDIIQKNINLIKTKETNENLKHTPGKALKKLTCLNGFDIIQKKLSEIRNELKLKEKEKNHKIREIQRRVLSNRKGSKRRRMEESNNTRNKTTQVIYCIPSNIPSASFNTVIDNENLINCKSPRKPSSVKKSTRKLSPSSVTCGRIYMTEDKIESKGPRKASCGCSISESSVEHYREESSKQRTTADAKSEKFRVKSPRKSNSIKNLSSCGGTCGRIYINEDKIKSKRHRRTSCRCTISESSIEYNHEESSNRRSNAGEKLKIKFRVQSPEKSSLMDDVSGRKFSLCSDNCERISTLKDGNEFESTVSKNSIEHNREEFSNGRINADEKMDELRVKSPRKPNKENPDIQNEVAETNLETEIYKRKISSGSADKTKGKFSSCNGKPVAEGPRKIPCSCTISKSSNGSYKKTLIHDEDTDKYLSKANKINNVTKDVLNLPQLTNVKIKHTQVESSNRHSNVDERMDKLRFQSPRKSNEERRHIQNKVAKPNLKTEIHKRKASTCTEDKTNRNFSSCNGKPLAEVPRKTSCGCTISESSNGSYKKTSIPNEVEKYLPKINGTNKIRTKDLLNTSQLMNDKIKHYHEELSKRCTDTDKKLKKRVLINEAPERERGAGETKTDRWKYDNSVDEKSIEYSKSINRNETKEEKRKRISLRVENISNNIEPFAISDDNADDVVCYRQYSYQDSTLIKYPSVANENIEELIVESFSESNQ